jgi:hypothetical protein
MADLRDRPGWEERLRAGIARLQPGQLERIMRYARSTGEIDVPPELWKQFGREMGDVIRPIMVAVYTQSVAQMAGQYPTLGVDWTLINRQAAQWASSYTFDLVKQIDDTTRDGLQKAIRSYFEMQKSMGELRKEIGEFIPTIQDKLGRTLFSATRAEMIATTEVSRASVAGELAWRAEIRADNPGIKMRAVFNTNADEIVCPVCAPLNQQAVTKGDYPPLHPRCRCWLNHEIANLRA